MKSFPQSKLGVLGFWVTFASAILLGLKFASMMPVPTPAIFALIFLGSILSIWAFVKGDRSWLQLLLTVPVFLFAFIWTLAEVIWPH